MAFKAKPVVLGNTETLIHECPVGTEAAAVLGFVNTSGSAVTFTVKFYSASLDETFSYGPLALAANTDAVASDRKFEIPLAMESGDKISALASTGAVVAAFATVTQGTPGPQFTGFTMAGAYDGGTNYGINHVVSVGGASYASRISDNIGNPPASSPTQWALLAAKGEPGIDGESFEWSGAYDGGTAYAAQEIVRHGGAVWIALQATTGNAPPTLPATSNAYWTLVVKDGELTEADIGVSVQPYDADTAKTDVAHAWSKGQRAGGVPVSISGGQVNWNLADGNVHTVAVDANFQYRLPGDIVTHIGQMGVFIFKQNGTGGFTWTVQSGIMPANSATLFAIAPGANKYTVVSYIVVSATEMIVAGLGGGVSL